MKKQTLAKLLVLVMVLALVPVAAFAGNTSNEDETGYYYDRDSDTVITPVEEPEKEPEEEKAADVEVATTTNADGSVVATVEVKDTVDAATMTAIIAQAKDSDVVVLKTSSNSVTVPASALADMARQTKADLVVNSSVATITIANSDLAGLASGAKNVEISAKSVGGNIQITVAKDGQNVDLSKGFQVELKAAAGAVVYIVNEDGTEIALEEGTDYVFENGVLIVTLTGSATLRLG